MKSAVNKQRLQTLLLLGLFVILGLYFSVQYYFLPTSRKASSLQQEVRTVRDRLRGLEAMTANQEALQAQYLQVEQAVASLRKSLPSESELPAVLEVISGLAAKANVKIQTIFPERTLSTSKLSTSSDPAVYKEVPIQVDALAGYHELGLFLNQIEVGDKPMQVLSLRITSNPKDPKRHQINLLLRAYFAIAEEVAINAT